MSVLKQYIRFLEEGNASGLIESLMHDPDTDGIREIYEESYTEDVFNIRSNGSSGRNTEYKFGPSRSVVPLMESVMRGMKSVEGLIRLNSSFPFYDTTRFELIELLDKSFLLKLDLTSKKSVEFFKKSVPPESTIETQPHICRMMLIYDEIIDHIKNNNIKVFSTCDDLSVTKEISIRNRMIDWKTGVNFFECDFGSLHFLPIWFEENGKSFNLLNTADKKGHEISDIFRAKSFHMCKCGKRAADIHFVSHFQFKPSTKKGIVFDFQTIEDISHNIPKNTLHIQFVEHENKLNILVDTPREFDPDPFKEIFSKEIVVLNKKAFRIGGYKMPFLWKAENYFNPIGTINPII